MPVAEAAAALATLVVTLDLALLRLGDELAALGAVDALADGAAGRKVRAGVELHQLCDVKAGGPQQLRLADVGVLQRVDALRAGSAR